MTFRVTSGHLGGAAPNKATEDRVLTSGQGTPLGVSPSGGLAQPTAYLIVGQLVPGLFAICEDLPQHNPQAPDVTFRGEFSVHDTLWRHPANGQHRVATDLAKKG